MSPQASVVVSKAATPERLQGRIILALALLVLAVLVAHGLQQRHDEAAALANWTDERAVASVALVAPHRDDSPRAFSLPGRIAAFYEAAINAQVTGYVKEWRKDIGATVRKGDVLAVIDTPELDERIAKSEDEVARAKAALSLAGVTAERWRSLRSSSAVSQQSSDEKESDLRVRQAEAGAAMAQLERLMAQKAFANVIAPFDGVVTARNIDIGSYIVVSGDSPPLFKVADIHTVRIYVSTPESLAADLRKGVSATLSSPQHPNRIFRSAVATTANAIDSPTRTLLVELDVDNPDGALLPGGYADVRFSLPTGKTGLLRIPASAAAVGGDGFRVATIENGRARFKKIAVAHDYGAEIEVASGLSPEDRLINNPGDGLEDGDRVRVGGKNAHETASDSGGAPSP